MVLISFMSVFHLFFDKLYLFQHHCHLSIGSVLFCIPVVQ